MSLQDIQTLDTLFDVFVVFFKNVFSPAGAFDYNKVEGNNSEIDVELDNDDFINFTADTLDNGHCVLTWTWTSQGEFIDEGNVEVKDMLELMKFIRETIEHANS